MSLVILNWLRFPWLFAMIFNVLCHLKYVELSCDRLKCPYYLQWVKSNRHFLGYFALDILDWSNTKIGLLRKSVIFRLLW